MPTTTEIQEARRRATGRQCGKCTMCCTILGVDELTKPPDTKCQHCAPGKGCSIYERRPISCRGFYCQWLVDPTLDDAWYPLAAKILIYPNAAGSEPGYVFEVDPHRPDRWLQQPYFERISNFAFVHRNSFVRAGKHWYLLLPREVAETHPKSPIRWGTKTVDFKPDKIGPSYFKSPDGDFHWVEVIPLAEFFDA